MSNTPQAGSPLTARLYKLEYPRSLGVYSTYAEVQAVVDALADHQFPVQNTMIVGTDLKLMERVTGRRTWGRVIGQGVLSGVWMGLFVGLILLLLSPGSPLVIVSSVLLGIVFFTVWSVIGYAMTGGTRDFTSMTATIPMQYELMVEHSHAEEARRILAGTSAPRPSGGAPGARVPTGPQTAVPTAPPVGGPSAGAPSVGTGTMGGAPSGGSPSVGSPSVGSPSVGSPSAAPHRPSYGRPAPTSPATGDAAAGSRPSRPSFGRPASSEPGAGAGPDGTAASASAAPQAPARSTPADAGSGEDPQQDDGTPPRRDP